MPSPSDIPEHLLQKEKKAEFITWLRTTPSTRTTRRTLMFLWRGMTGGKHDITDFHAAMENALPEKLPNVSKIPPPTT